MTYVTKIDSQPFAIELDFEGRIMTVKVLGYWTLDVARIFVGEARIATARMRAQGGWFDMITNIGTAPPLPRDASDYLEREQGNARPADVRKMAYICASMLGRLQLRRMTAKDPNMAVFSNERDVRAWLSEGR